MPLTYTPLGLKGLDLEDPRQLREFQKQTCDFLNAAFTAPGITGFLNGPGLLNGNSLSQFSVNFATETANRTVDTKTAQSVMLALVVTGAINYTLTINNLVPGAVLGLRLLNSSGAGRTFTVLANNPAGSAYSVLLIGTGTPLILSSGVAISSGAAWNGFGAVISAASDLFLFGGVGT